MGSGATAVVTDPDTGEEVMLAVYSNRRRNARRPWVIQRLSGQHLPPTGTTPPRLVESRLRFAGLSVKARGSRFADPFPATAELIQDRFHDVAQTFEQPRHS